MQMLSALVAERARIRKSRDFRGFPSAPERTRTSTDHSVHKALNTGRRVWVLPGASKSSKLRGSVDGMDGLDGMDVATGVATAQAGSRGTITT